MATCKDYVIVKSLEEAYNLNQKKNNQIIAGNGWLKMSRNPKGTLIDLSALGLDKVEETDNEFIIGCMTPLRTLELHEGLNSYTNNAIKNSLENIVGTQFRNTVTIGGSIWSRFGFSDVLTIFLALNTEVELYNRKRITLDEFSKLKYDKDILVNIIVKKEPIKVCYEHFRNQKTDFPVLTLALSKVNDKYRLVVGSTPYKAKLIETNEINEELLNKFKIASNMRASQYYRHNLAKVLLKRALAKVGEKNGN